MLILYKQLFIGLSAMYKPFSAISCRPVEEGKTSFINHFYRKRANNHVILEQYKIEKLMVHLTNY